MDKTITMRFLILISAAFLFSACPSSERIVEVEESFLEDQLEVDLQDKMNPKRIEVSFPSMGLKFLCTVNEEKNIVVFEFDTKIKSKKEMMKFLMNEVGISYVQETRGCP